MKSKFWKKIAPNLEKLAIFRANSYSNMTRFLMNLRVHFLMIFLGLKILKTNLHEHFLFQWYENLRCDLRLCRA